MLLHARRALRLTSRGLILGWAAALVSACITDSPNNAGYGVQSGHEGFVPARIAILPCQLWPPSSPFKAYTAPLVSKATLDRVCEKFDREIVEGFERQPYMKGFTPRFVKKSLESAGLPDHLAKLPTLWAPKAPGCSKLPSAAQCYKGHVATLPAWNIWLTQLSESTRHADALLVPMITGVHEERVSERGLELAARSLSVDLLLIDISRGELLWAGGSSGREAKKRLAGRGPLEGLPYPEWEEILSLVFTANLWRDFPGRQVL